VLFSGGFVDINSGLEIKNEQENELDRLKKQLEAVTMDRSRLSHLLAEREKEIVQLKYRLSWQEDLASGQNSENLSGRNLQDSPGNFQFAEYKVELLFNAVCEINRTVMELASSNQVLGSIMQQAQFVLEAAAGSVLLMSADGTKLYFEVAQGEKGDEIRRQYLDINQGIGGLVARTNSSLLENDPYSNPNFNSSFDKKTAFKTRNILCVPMRDGDRVLGVLQVINTIGRPSFDLKDLKILELFARQASFVILNQRMIENLHEQNTELQASSRMKSVFLATMSHEIRTPMTAIIGMTDLLLETELEEEQRMFLDTVKSSSEFLLQLLNDILDFSKIEANRLEIEEIEFNPSHCVSDLLKPFGLQASEKKLALLCRIAPEFPEVLIGDAGRFRQVLTNLVGNALKFTKEGEVVVDVGGDFIDGGKKFRLLCSVCDTGIGVPEDKRELIFDSFSQADVSTTRKYGGTGLGLAISRNLARMMGGDIWVESAENQGSVFNFTAVMGGVSKTSVAETGVIELKDREILLVADNKTTQKNMEELFTYWRMKVGKATSTSDVLDMIVGENFYYDLIVVDFSKIENDCFVLAKALRLVNMLDKVPILLLINTGLRGDAKRCREIGIEGYLVKPVLPLELKQAVSFLLMPPEKRGRCDALLTRHLLRELKTGLRVLVFEEEIEVRNVVMAVLEKNNHSCDIVFGEPEAMDRFSSGGFDLVVCGLPEKEAEWNKRLELFCRKEKTVNMPLLALVPGDGMVEFVSGFSGLVDGFICKPISEEAFLREFNRIGFAPKE
jgi:signal transduction histidine kinase/DNA-binding response OmpR family regulator